jgi:hypothetical protein
MTFCMQGRIDKCYRPAIGPRAPLSVRLALQKHYSYERHRGEPGHTHIIHVDNNSGKVHTSQDTGSWR